MIRYTNIQAQVRKLRLTFIRIYKQITNYTYTREIFIVYSSSSISKLSSSSGALSLSFPHSKSSIVKPLDGDCAWTLMYR